MYGFAVENIVNQFRARFQPGGEDHLYFHNGGAAGIPCTYDEAMALSRAYETTVRRWARGMIAWVLLSALVLGVYAAAQNFEPSRWEAAAIFLAPFPFAILALKRASDAPLEKFRMRAAVAPQRASETARAARLAALPDGVIGAIVVVNALLAWSFLRDGFQSDDWVYVMIILVSAALFGAILKAKAGR